MAIQIYSEQQIHEQALAYFRAVFPTKDLSDKGFLGLLARALAQLVSSVQKAVQDADWDATPAYQIDADGTIRSRTSSEALDAWAFVFGLPSEVPGIYGRRGALAAAGGKGVPSGVAGTVVTDGALLVDSSGAIVLRLSGNLTLNGPPNINVATFVAVTAGAAGDLPVGSVLTWVSPPPGLDSSVTLTQALTGGQDRESDYDLVARILRRLQLPPRGGAAVDYRTWAEESLDSNGVTLAINRAYIYPLRGGVGTVDVLITQAGSGTARKPSPGTQAAVLAYVNKLRPVTAFPRIILPYMPGANALTIRIRPTPAAPRYAFDWVDGGSPTAILSYSNTGPSIVINTVTFPTLQAAIDTNLKPRIALSNTGAGALPTPYQARVLSYQKNVPAAGQTTLTLDRQISPAPQAGDVYFAGGGCVDLVAKAILNYVDRLGPSRSSGYADEYDNWEYIVSIARIADEALDVLDADGSRVIGNIPNLATTGVTVAVGVGAPAAVDYVTSDVAPNGPELAFLKFVQVTQ